MFVNYFNWKREIADVMFAFTNLIDYLANAEKDLAGFGKSGRPMTGFCAPPPSPVGAPTARYLRSNVRMYRAVLCPRHNRAFRNARTSVHPDDLPRPLPCLVFVLELQLVEPASQRPLVHSASSRCPAS